MFLNLHEFVSILKQIAKDIHEKNKDYFSERKEQTVYEIVKQIQTHHNTRKVEKKLLGMLFHFYTLDIGGFRFKIETKGKQKEKILYFTIDDRNGRFYSYQSYSDEDRLHKKITIKVKKNS